MQKTFWLIPAKLAGRAGPSLYAWDLPAIRRAGITTILSTDDQCDSAAIQTAGLKHIEKYMPASFPTNDALVDRFVSLVQDATAALLEALSRGERVLVHCYAGRDRTGLVLAAALMELESLDARAALARVRAVRPEAMTSPGILAVLEEYERRQKTRL